MIDINTLSIIIWFSFIHWCADFVLQSDWMAKNKSSNIYALLSHGAVYTAVISIFFGLQIGLFNGLIHILIDGFTSRVNKYLWESNRVHDFFVNVGLDQLLHALIFCLSLYLFKS